MSKTKSAHALILNTLVAMQRAPYYATVREDLALAESVIVQLEAENTILTQELLKFTEADKQEYCATKDHLELAARKRRRTVSSFVERAMED